MRYQVIVSDFAGNEYVNYESDLKGECEMFVQNQSRYVPPGHRIFVRERSVT